MPQSIVNFDPYVTLPVSGSKALPIDAMANFHSFEAGTKNQHRSCPPSIDNSQSGRPSRYVTQAID